MKRLLWFGHDSTAQGDKVINYLRYNVRICIRQEHELSKSWLMASPSAVPGIGRARYDIDMRLVKDKNDDDHVILLQNISKLNIMNTTRSTKNNRYVAHSWFCEYIKSIFASGCFLRKSHVSRKKCKNTGCHLLISVKVTSQLFMLICLTNPSIRMKGQVYTECISSCLLYGCESWTMRAELESNMESTEMRMIRWMCRVSQREKQPSTELRRRLGVEAIGDVMRTPILHRLFQTPVSQSSWQAVIINDWQKLSLSVSVSASARYSIPQCVRLIAGGGGVDWAESTTDYTFTPCVGSFTSPGIDTR